MADDVISIGKSPFVLSSERTQSIQFNSKPCLTIKADGTVEIGEGLTPDEAGRQAIDAMQYQLSFVIEQAKTDARREIIEQLTRNGYGNLFDGDKVRPI